MEAIRFTGRADLARTINERAARSGLKWKVRGSKQANAAEMTVDDLHEMATALGMTVKYLCNVTAGCNEPAFVRLGDERLPCRECYKKMKAGA